MTPLEGTLLTLATCSIMTGIYTLGSIWREKHGRHRQAPTPLQGDPGQPGHDPGNPGAKQARIARAHALKTIASAYTAAGRTGAGVMASRLTSGFTVQGCAVCHVNPAAGPSGMCAACAGGVTGKGSLGTQCGQCGTVFHTSDVACPACMVKMMQQMQNMSQVAAKSISGGGTTAMSPQQPELLPRADMQVVDLVGWRVWRITATGYLRSVTAPRIWWPDQPMEAETVEDHGAGANGIHVFIDRRSALLEVETYLGYGNGRETNPNYAIGSVLLWGDVVEHERGYRAERAQILSIDDVTWKGKPPWDKETAEVFRFLRKRYGVGERPDG